MNFHLKLVKSRIGRPKDQKATLDALGLRKINSERTIENVNPQLAGMIRKVEHLLEVTEIR